MLHQRLRPFQSACCARCVSTISNAFDVDFRIAQPHAFYLSWGIVRAALRCNGFTSSSEMVCLNERSFFVDRLELEGGSGGGSSRATLSWLACKPGSFLLGLALENGYGGRWLAAAL